VAAGHLEEHRATLDTVVSTLEEDVRRLAVPEILLGFTIDASIRTEDEPEEEDASAAAETTVWIWLSLWPASLTPAGVAITPRVADTPAAMWRWPLHWTMSSHRPLVCRPNACRARSPRSLWLAGPLTRSTSAMRTKMKMASRLMATRTTDHGGHASVGCTRPLSPAGRLKMGGEPSVAVVKVGTVGTCRRRAVRKAAGDAKLTWSTAQRWARRNPTRRIGRGGAPGTPRRRSAGKSRVA